MPLKRDRRRARAALANAGVLAAERERARYEAIGAQVERDTWALEYIWPIAMALLWDNVAIVALEHEAARMAEALEDYCADAPEDD